MTKQPRHFETRRVLGQLLDRISAVSQDSLVAVDERDGASAGSGVHERRIVAQKPGVVFVFGADLPKIIGANRAVSHGKVVRFPGTVVGYVDRSLGSWRRFISGGLGHAFSWCC